MRFIFYGLVVLTILLNHSLFAQSADSTLHLDQLIAEAITNNPELKSIAHALQSAKARVPQAGALPDPSLKVGLMNLPVDSWQFDQEPMTGKQIGIMQKFPFPGKLGLRKNIARDNAQIAELNLGEAKNNLILKVRETYYQLFYVERAIATNEKNALLLQQFIGIADTRYRVGKGLQQDVLRAQVAWSKIQDNLIDLRQTRRNLSAQMNFLLNRPANGVIGKSEQPDFPVMNLQLSQLRQLADQNRPLLQSWITKQQQSKRQISLARKGYLPDFSAEVSYSQRDELVNGMKGVDFLSGMVRLNLPLYFWQKQKKQVEEKKYQELSVQRKYESVREWVNSELEKNLTQLQSNFERERLYKNTIIPQANQTLNSSLAAYQVDKLDFQAVVDNQMRLFKYELDYYRVYSNYLINLARLTFITGQELNAK